MFLEDDPSQGDADRYGRSLCYVWLADGRLFNLELVAQGYAFEYTYNLPYRYQAPFQQTERNAREQQRGLWAPSACNGEHRPADEAPGDAAPAAPPTAAPAQPTVGTTHRVALTITRTPGTVRRDARATVAAHTTPGTPCTIVVRSKSGPSKAQGLGAKTANAKGDVSWSWKVGTRTTPGNLDGNGRAARLLLNLQLMRDGYPAALLLAGWRPRYIHALEQAHHGQYSQLVNLIGRAVESGLDMFLEACAAIPEALQRPLREVADACAMPADYLGWLLREGRIAGQKRRGRWYTSEAAVRRYQQEVASQAIAIGRPRRRSTPDT